jgi:(1->4)-alpha-D-glucan 1-alpha-D-glucosylmutase
LRRLAGELAGDHEDFNDVAREAKHQVLHEVLAAEMSRLTELFVEVCEQHRRYRDFSRRELHEVLCEVLASFPVYRTYVDEDGTHSAVDVAHIDGAVDSARTQRSDLDDDLFDLVRAVLSAGPEFATPAAVELRMRFQQLSGPVMAKGVEDTALYRWLALISLNEVGGDPRRFGVSPEDFHATCARQQRRHPGTMLALSTHDTKRSEDVRARLALLSELPDRWSTAVRRWMAMNDRHRRCEWPDRATEYLLYQTLVGAYPLSTERATAYLEKAIREAKRHTSWLEQRSDYEAATRDFTGSVLADDRFVGELEEFVIPLVRPGRINALAQKLVQLTAPGVPDIYQGSELWELSLVDPDNRRPVDYAARAEMLAAAVGPDAIPRAAELADDGFAKLVVVQRALGLRRREPEAFGPASTYRSLAVQGPRARHVVAFSRAERAVTIVPRLVQRVGCDWLGTEVELPDGSWRDLLASDGTVFEGSVEMSELFRSFPVSLLAPEEL